MMTNTNVRRVGVLVFIFVLASHLQCNELSPSRSAPPLSENSEARSISSEGKIATGSGKYALSTSLSRGWSSEAYAQDLPAKQAASQQLVYNSEMELLVNNFREGEERIKAVAEKSQGYVSETRSFTNSEGKLQGTLKLRVPSNKFREALAALSGLGTIRSMREWTEDVTEEYVDVTTRIQNLHTLESRLLGLLEKKDAKLSDLVAVEGKLAEVRTQIEQYTGKLRYLKNKIELSIINITLFEPDSSKAERDSVLMPIRWAAKQVGMIFFGSVGALLLAVVGIVPWVLIIYGIIKGIIAMRRRKKARAVDVDKVEKVA